MIRITTAITITTSTPTATPAPIAAPVLFFLLGRGVPAVTVSVTLPSFERVVYGVENDGVDEPKTQIYTCIS